MLEKLIERLLFGFVMDRAEKADQKFIENHNEEQLQENVIFKGYEYQYLENLAASARMMKMCKTNTFMYKTCLASYTLYFEDHVYLNNYKKEGLNLTYQQLAEHKRNGNLKFNRGRGIVTIKLENKQKYLMYVCGSDKDRDKEPEITKQIAEFLKLKCGVDILSK